MGWLRCLSRSFLAASALAAAMSAKSELVTLDFRADVVSWSGPADTAIPAVGQRLGGSFTYDVTTPADVVFPGYSAEYAAALQDLTLGSTVRFSPFWRGSITIQNDLQPPAWIRDQFTLVASGLDGPGFGLFRPNSLEMRLRDAEGDGLSSFALPTGLILSRFEESYLNLGLSRGDVAGTLRFRITSLEVRTVAEATSLAVVGLGLLLLFSAGRGFPSRPR